MRSQKIDESTSALDWSAFDRKVFALQQRLMRVQEQRWSEKGLDAKEMRLIDALSQVLEKEEELAVAPINEVLGESRDEKPNADSAKKATPQVQWFKSLMNESPKEWVKLLSTAWVDSESSKNNTDEKRVRWVLASYETVQEQLFALEFVLSALISKVGISALKNEAKELGLKLGVDEQDLLVLGTSVPVLNAKLTQACEDSAALGQWIEQLQHCYKTVQQQLETIVVSVNDKSKAISDNPVVREKAQAIKKELMMNWEWRFRVGNVGLYGGDPEEGISFAEQVEQNNGLVFLAKKPWLRWIEEREALATGNSPDDGKKAPKIKVPENVLKNTYTRQKQIQEQMALIKQWMRPVVPEVIMEEVEYTPGHWLHRLQTVIHAINTREVPDVKLEKGWWGSSGEGMNVEAMRVGFSGMIVSAGNCVASSELLKNLSKGLTPEQGKLIEELVKHSVVENDIEGARKKLKELFKTTPDWEQTEERFFGLKKTRVRPENQKLEQIINELNWTDLSRRIAQLHEKMQQCLKSETAEKVQQCDASQEDEENDSNALMNKALYRRR